MTRIEALEKEVESLSADELAVFRAWFAEFDAAAWDRQIAEDGRLGRLDALVAEASRDSKAGKHTDRRSIRLRRGSGPATAR